MFQDRIILDCEPMPNVMAALPNIGGALCSREKKKPQGKNIMACPIP